MMTADVCSGSTSGYLHPGYAESLSEFGAPRALANSQGWILARRISDSKYIDGMGTYPIFACQDWSRLEEDLEQIGEELVCISLVTDPFGAYDANYLRQCFGDVVTPFKEHFVVDLSRPFDTFVHSHHRRKTRKALRQVSVVECANPVNFLDEWTALYGTLVERHGITGIAAFSRESFARQLTLPGMTAFRAMHNDATVGMLLWYEQGERAYYHLGAYSPVGYELGASFALFDYSIKYFAQRRVLWLNLGAAAGSGTTEDFGLSRFKQGWSTGTRTAYLCGRIFDRKKYQELVLAKNVPPTEYFPAYRFGEFSGRPPMG